MSPKRTCDQSPKHRGPFFTVTVMAREAGRGSRLGGKPRREYRHVLGHVCRKCLRAAIIKARGKNLLPRKGRKIRAGKVAVPPCQNLPGNTDAPSRILGPGNGGEPWGNRALEGLKNGAS
jgi:hypothetical protein